MHYPPVSAGKMVYFSISASHLCVEIRCYKHGAPALDGVAREVDDDARKSLCFDAGRPGRRFIVLREDSFNSLTIYFNASRLMPPTQGFMRVWLARALPSIRM